MAGAVDTPIVRKFASLLSLDAEELRWLELSTGPLRTSSARRDVIVQGRPIPYMAVVQDGWLFQYKRRSDGRRQILNFILPGDVVGLHRRVVQISPYSVHSVTTARMATISDAQMSVLVREQPRLAEAMFRLSANEVSMLGEQAVRLGRLSARERVAHLLVELSTRLHRTGGTTDGSFFFPITQEMMADALGLSVMHIHRMLRALQGEGLITLAERRMTLHDPAALARIAGLDSAYLDVGVDPGG